MILQTIRQTIFTTYFFGEFWFNVFVDKAVKVHIYWLPALLIVLATQTVVIGTYGLFISFIMDRRVQSTTIFSIAKDRFDLVAVVQVIFAVIDPCTVVTAECFCTALVSCAVPSGDGRDLVSIIEIVIAVVDACSTIRVPSLLSVFCHKLGV